MDKIIALCKKYKVAKLWVFGSILTPRFNDDSDVDFLVDFDEANIDLLDYADNFFNFIYEIETVVGRKVDMVVDKSIKNRFFREEINETRKLVWPCGLCKWEVPRKGSKCAERLNSHQEAFLTTRQISLL